jgi:hypothetical protein
LTGLFLASVLGSGIVLDALMVIACGLSFAAIVVHTGAWVYFFMVFVAIGWQGLDPEALDLTVAGRLYGETAGVMVAMLAIMLPAVAAEQKKRAKRGRVAKSAGERPVISIVVQLPGSNFRPLQQCLGLLALFRVPVSAPSNLLGQMIPNSESAPTELGLEVLVNFEDKLENQ